MTQPHILSRLSRGLQRCRFIFFDVETVPDYTAGKRTYQLFKLLTACYASFRPETGFVTHETVHFYELKPFHTWVDKLIRDKTVLYVLSANIWFDLRTSGLLMYWLRNKRRIKHCYINGLTHIISFVHNETNIKCLNINQFFPVSVREMGKTLDLPKYDVDFRAVSDQELLSYCYRDTEIITRMFERWLTYLADNDLGPMAVTLASQSMATYRYKFMGKDIHIHSNPILSDYERESYHGGRVEIYRQGKIRIKQAYKLDINSMYPSIMLKKAMPVRVVSVESFPSLKLFAKLLQQYFCIARVAIETDKPIYPLVRDNKLIFPIGRFVCTLSQPELQHAFECGHIASIHSVYTYKQAVIFDNFVEYFYSQRLAAKRAKDAVTDYCSKIMMNSLYGKFGQRRDKEILNEWVEEERYESNILICDGELTGYRELILGHNRTVYQERIDIARHTFYPIASAVTSYARLQLWLLMETAGLDNVYYVDTDALFVNSRGYVRLQDDIDNSKLGMLAVEETTDNLCLYGPKDYVFGDKHVIKGVRRNAERVGRATYKQTTFPGFRGDLQHGLDKPYSIMATTKTLKREYTKGVVSPTGKVTPFVVSDF